MVRIKGNPVDLPMVFMQPGNFHTWAVKVIHHNFSIGGGSCNCAAVLPVRPFYIVNVQVVAVSRGIVTVLVDDGGAKIGVSVTCSANYADGLENLSPCEDGMCPLVVDIDRSDLGCAFDGQTGVLWCVRIESA
jgi:hypothetical protein